MAAAGQLLLTPRLRPRTGPALRTAPLPVTAAVLSALLHGTLALAIVLAATVWSKSQPKTYVVNLVPAIAAVGTPQGRPAAPPRAEEPPPRVAPGALDAQLRAAFGNRNDKTLYLKADAGLAYGAVIETMDQVRRAGIERLGMVTEPTRER